MPVIQPKKYENAPPGVYLATIIDVVDLGLVQGTKGDPYPAIAVVWILDNSKLDSKGQPFQIRSTMSATISGRTSKTKSRLVSLAAKVLGTDYSGQAFDTELLVGRSNQICAEQNGDYTNVTSILPFPEGQPAPKAPAGFIRAKDRQPNAAAPAAAPAATAPVTQAAPVGF